MPLASWNSTFKLTKTAPELAHPSSLKRKEKPQRGREIPTEEPRWYCGSLKSWWLINSLSTVSRSLLFYALLLFITG